MRISALEYYETINEERQHSGLPFFSVLHEVVMLPSATGVF